MREEDRQELRPRVDARPKEEAKEVDVQEETPNKVANEAILARKRVRSRNGKGIST